MGLSIAQYISDAVAKLEGTSQTFGQKVELVSEGQIESENGVDTSVAYEAAGGSQRSYGKSPTFGGTIGGPQNTIVKVVENIGDLEDAINALGEVSNLGCKVTSNIAVAAASTNKEATVVMPAGTTTQTKSDILSKSPFLGSFLKLNTTSVIPNIVSYAVVAGSSIKTKEEIKDILTEAQKVDLSISLKSKKSESLEINLLKTPRLNVEFIYNFFSEQEGDIRSQEDQSRDPLLIKKPVDVPKYVELKWNTATVTNSLTGTEKIVKQHEELRTEVFSKPRGVTGYDVSSFPNSLAKSKKNFNAYNDGNISKEITDIHSLEKGFNAIANNKTFANSISVVLNTVNQQNSLNIIPFEDIKKNV